MNVLVDLRSTASAPLAIVGNYPPRRCGIATFTQDLHRALCAAAPDRRCLAVAVSDAHGPYAYPAEVSVEIDQDDPASYIAAADRLNQAGVAAVSLQHEFGIFGGPAGSHVLALLDRLQAEVVITLHTVLTHPDAEQRRVMERLIARSARLVVMAEKGRQILIDTYGVAQAKIAVVPHGIPDQPLMHPGQAKADLDAAGRKVLLTFGLLSPNKGIEVVIEALPAIVRAHPDLLYLVVGATHPNLRRHEGERYRESLADRAAALGVERNIRFIDGFLDLPDLLDYIAAADIYVTPYLNEAQITSGTLAYAVGLGKAVVSTPYWYARELLADGRGVLVPFADVRAIGETISGLLANPVLRARLERSAALLGTAMCWSAVGRRHLALLARGRGGRQLVARPQPFKEKAMPSAAASREGVVDATLALAGVA